MQNSFEQDSLQDLAPPWKHQMPHEIDEIGIEVVNWVNGVNLNYLVE